MMGSSDLSKSIAADDTGISQVDLDLRHAAVALDLVKNCAGLVSLVVCKFDNRGGLDQTHSGSPAALVLSAITLLESAKEMCPPSETEDREFLQDIVDELQEKLELVMQVEERTDLKRPN